MLYVMLYCAVCNAIVYYVYAVLCCFYAVFMLFLCCFCAQNDRFDTAAYNAAAGSASPIRE